MIYKSEEYDKQAGIEWVTNEPVWPVFYHLLISDNSHAGREIATKYFDGIETESETGVDEGDAEPGEENARTRDGYGRNFQSQQHAEGVADPDHVLWDPVQPSVSILHER